MQDCWQQTTCDKAKDNYSSIFAIAFGYENVLEVIKYKDRRDALPANALWLQHCQISILSAGRFSEINNRPQSPWAMDAWLSLFNRDFSCAKKSKFWTGSSGNLTAVGNRRILGLKVLHKCTSYSWLTLSTSTLFWSSIGGLSNICQIETLFSTRLKWV